MNFTDLRLEEPILRALHQEGYDSPTPIQQQAIPPALLGKDVLGCAQTGTGKTAAFAIPILQNLLLQSKNGRQADGLKALILTPTRELAIQIGESFTSYGKYTGLRHTVIFGGVSQHSQANILRRGVDILVATPGRMLDLMAQRLISLQHLQTFVLDEADRMLDMGFITDVRKIISRLPEKRQTLFFSATMPGAIARLSSSILHQPVRVEVTPVASTAEHVQQTVYLVEKHDKINLLIHLLADGSITQALIFTRTKYGADKLAKALLRARINADAIHGNKTQGARQKALSNFKAGKIRVLVATDIAARGIDIDDLSHVFNFELPDVAETYVHRIGRTGRAGNSGIAFSFCDMTERTLLRDINKLTNQTIPVAEGHLYASDMPFAIAKPSQNNPYSRRPSSHSGFRKGRSWSQGRSVAR